VATAILGVGFIWAAAWGSDTAKGLAMFVGTAGLVGLSLGAVGRPVDPRRRRVLRGVVLGAHGDQGTYRAHPVGVATVDGEDVGAPTAVAVVRWTSPATKGAGLTRYEISLVTARGVFVLGETGDKDVEPFAPRLREALGDRVKLIDAYEQLPEVNFFVWLLAGFTIAVAMMPMPVSAARHGAVAIAGVALLLSTVVSARTWLLARSMRDAQRIYRLPGNAGTPPSRRPWVVLSLLAIAIFWGALLWPRGAGLTMGGAPDERGFIPVWLGALALVLQICLVAWPCLGGSEDDPWR
jgi:hypothetical protein